MAVYVECKNKDTNKRNTGAKEQCIEGIMTRPAVSVPEFKFASIADAKNLEKWNEAVAAKQLFPLYDAEELTTANTEDTFFEGRNQKYVTSRGKKSTTYTSILGLCSNAALKSFNGADMKLFEFTEDGKVKGVTNDAGEYFGQSITLDVGKRLDATADRPPSTLVTINYKDYNEFEDDGAIIVPGWRVGDLFGIFDVHLVQVSATATNIKFSANDGCAGGGETLDTLTLANIKVKDLTGANVTVSFTAADADGVYTLTGTGFQTGYTVSLDGVVTIGDMSYETPIPLKITVTP